MARKSGKSKNTGTKAVFVMNEVNDISSINSLYSELNKILKKNRNVCVDATNVRKLDSAAIQLLGCWTKEARERKINVTWKNADNTVFQKARTLGLEQHLLLN